jgi:CRP-like cAMP-binding protein
VSVAALQAVAQRLRSAQETIRQLSAFPVEQRVAAILLKLGAKLGEAHGQELLLQVPLTRQDLAGMAGATVETTSRIVSRLEAAGVVRTGRQWIAIVDPEQLATLAQEG